MRATLLLVGFFMIGAVSAGALPVEKLTIDTAKGPHGFTVEIAADDASRDRGLMFRKKLAPNAGMIFDFHQPMMVAFWMKDTPLSLDMLFVKEDGTISTIAAHAVPFSTAQIQSVEPVRAVIELNAGRAAELGIAPGDRVRDGVFGGLAKKAAH
ncbi:MAG TPA: DUF192 domain-containing protein [Rhizomicrobium sp.]